MGALSGRLQFTVGRDKLNNDSLFFAEPFIEEAFLLSGAESKAPMVNVDVANEKLQCDGPVSGSALN